MYPVLHKSLAVDKPFECYYCSRHFTALQFGPHVTVCMVKNWHERVELGETEQKEFECPYCHAYFAAIHHHVSECKARTLYEQQYRAFQEVRMNSLFVRMADQEARRQVKERIHSMYKGLNFYPNDIYSRDDYEQPYQVQLDEWEYQCCMDGKDEEHTLELTRPHDRLDPMKIPKSVSRHSWGFVFPPSVVSAILILTLLSQSRSLFCFFGYHCYLSYIAGIIGLVMAVFLCII
jgi:uncharacterized Zn-finger protein